MKNNLKFHVYPKACKANKQGLIPIYIRITLNSVRWEYSTKHFIDLKNWDPKNSKIKGNGKEASTINGQVELVKTKVNSILLEYNFKDEVLELETIKESIQGNPKKQRTLIPIFQHHNEQMKALVPQEYAPGTLERYETSLKHTQDFLHYQYKVRREKSPEVKAENREQRAAITTQIDPLREKLRRAKDVLEKSPHVYELLKNEHELERTAYSRNKGRNR